MYNLHTHSLLSDGSLLPSEIAVRYLAAGYKVIAITDHVDYSNIDLVIPAILKFTRNWPKDSKIRVLPGVELTHLPLGQFTSMVKYCRKKGIKIIIGHGQTTAEPVFQGTNRAALEADIDILAHPGYISDDDTKLAKERGIFLEITSREGHNRTNAFVVKQALKFKARMLLSHDSHEPEDIISPQQLRRVGIKAGLTASQVASIYKDTAKFLAKI
jgi:histidinol phosphatase-like PHP family hydrolase